MNDHHSQKVTAGHLKRDAYLYVRQSTIRQVFENTESTRRQYALRQRAVSLGWPVERVIVIDSDLGQSGASGVDREGFKKLVSEVGLGHAGIVRAWLDFLALPGPACPSPPILVPLAAFLECYEVHHAGGVVLIPLHARAFEP